MAEIRWIKLAVDMFDDEKLDVIMSMPDSDALVVIWVRLLTMAGRCNAGGYIFLTENIPYDPDMLAHKFRKNVNTIKLALSTFSKLGMIEIDESQRIFLVNWGKHQNLDGLEQIREQTRKRVAAHREKIKCLAASNAISNVTVTPSNETEQEHRLEEDKDKRTTTQTAAVDKLTKLKEILGSKTAKKWISLKGTEYCLQQLRVMETKGEQIHSPHAWLLQSLSENWAHWKPPPVKPNPGCSHCHGAGVIVDFLNNKTKSCACINSEGASKT